MPKAQISSAGDRDDVMKTKMLEMFRGYCEGTSDTSRAMEREGQQLAELSTKYVLSKIFYGVRLPLSCIMHVYRRLWRVGRSIRFFIQKLDCHWRMEASITLSLVRRLHWPIAIDSNSDTSSDTTGLNFPVLRE